jgi:hypothetical protein
MTRIAVRRLPLWPGPLALLPLLAACAVPAPQLSLPGYGSGRPIAEAPAAPTVTPAAPVAPAAPAPPIASVRHVSSTEPYGDGRLHLFLFTPDAPRPLDTRLASARAAIAADPACDWIDAPRDVIIAETAKQGAAYSDTLLVAPLDCS